MTILRILKVSTTYFVRGYSDILEILKNPLQNLLCLEAKFINSVSNIARKPRPDSNVDGRLIAHRFLARQSQGECDDYHTTTKYFEFGLADRSTELLFAIRDAVVTYINCVLEYPSYSWDIFTYVPDKLTTKPANKMQELFESHCCSSSTKNNSFRMP